MLEVTAAQYIGPFRIRVRFNNGDKGVVDLADTLQHPMFEPLKDPTVFRRFEVWDVLHESIYVTPVGAVGATSL
jgi:hypothetical protein